MLRKTFRKYGFRMWTVFMWFRRIPVEASSY